jgi:hypothetical protein
MIITGVIIRREGCTEDLDNGDDNLIDVDIEYVYVDEKDEEDDSSDTK